MQTDEWEPPNVERLSTGNPVVAVDVGKGRFALVRESTLEGKDKITLSDTLGSHGKLLTCILRDLMRPKGLHEWRCQNPLCRKIFETTNRRKIYCSKKCRIQAYIGRRRVRQFKLWDKTCTHCGKRFISKRRDARFCRPAHQKAARRKTLNRKILKRISN